jgi:hypothetical protein
MTTHDIPNDDLGEWGEAQFRALCAASGLVANKAERDKMGWDFLVELPPSGTLPLDQRPNGLRCRVQIKTQWQTEGSRFKMSLSAAERLAKDPGPSFILLLSAKRPDEGSDPELVECHLIHVLGINLERVLKRLREAAADTQAAPLNEQTISYSGSTAGEKLAITGSAIRDALTRTCGADPHVYIEMKKQQLTELGYTQGRYQLDTTISANNIDEFVEMMLGLRPLSVDTLKTFDVRFGTLVPANHVPTGDNVTFLIQPKAAACTIRVRSKSLTPPAVFQGEVVVPVHPRIPNEYMRMLVKAKFFSLDLRATGETAFKFELPNLMSAELDLEGWRNHLRLMELLGSTDIYFDIQSARPSTPISTLTPHQTTPLPQEPWLAPMADIVRRSEALLTYAGGRGKLTTLATLAESADSIWRAHVSMLEPTSLPPQTFETSDTRAPESLLPSCDTDFLCADYAPVAGVMLAYAYRITMRPERSGEGRLWRQVDINPELLESIDATAEAFAAFVARAKAQTGLTNTIARLFGDDAGARHGQAASPDEPQP